MAKHIKKLNTKQSHKKGCVTKHEGKFTKDRCAYRWNGYLEMLTARKSLYEIDFTRKQNYVRLPWIYKEKKLGFAKRLASSWRWLDDPTEIPNAWWFKGANYKFGYLPFNHNYHHIMPFDSLQSLGYQELDILQESGYNLNDRPNMIILPCLDAYGIAMKLPAHPTNHPTYNANVKAIIAQIRQDIVGKQKKHEINEENVQNFRKKLEGWEKSQFDEIVEYGESLAAELDPENLAEPNQIDGCPMAS